MSSSGLAAPVAPTLIIAEEEGAVLDDRPAHGEAELRQVGVRLGHAESALRAFSALLTL